MPHHSPDTTTAAADVADWIDCPEAFRLSAPGGESANHANQAIGHDPPR